MNSSRFSVRVRGILGLAIMSSLVLVAAAGLPGNAAPEVPTLVKSDDETTPVTHTGDAADEPTVWVNQANPGQSLILGNDKKGSFESYDLNGDLVQRITDATPFWGNSDVRPNVTIGGFHGDLITVSHGTGFKAYTVDPRPGSCNRSTKAMSSAPATPKACACTTARAARSTSRR